MNVILVIGTDNDLISKKRIDRAIEYFRSVKAEYIDEETYDGHILTYIMFCGKVDQYVNYALSQGIDKKFLLEVKQNTDNTVENILFAKKIIDDIQKRTEYDIKIILCTSSFHIKRTFMITRTFMNDYMSEFIYTNEPIENSVQVQETFLLDQFLEQILYK